MIHEGLNNIISLFPSESAFLMHNPVEIAKMLIAQLPNLLDDTSKSSLAYIKSEEERISKLIMNV